MTSNVHLLKFLVKNSPDFKAEIPLPIKVYLDDRVLVELFKDLEPDRKRVLDILIDNGGNEIEISENIVTNMIGAAAAINNVKLLQYLLTKFNQD